jgi:hypothetical protein
VGRLSNGPAPPAASGGDARASRDGKKGQGVHQLTDRPITPRHVAMNWAQRLKHVFAIEVATRTCCGGKPEVIAGVEQPQVIAKILSQLERTTPEPYPSERPLGARASPQLTRLICHLIEDPRSPVAQHAAGTLSSRSRHRCARECGRCRLPCGSCGRLTRSG